MNNTIKINGQLFVIAEQFRALGTNWIRYIHMRDVHRDKEGLYVENKYATQVEWNMLND